MQALLLAGLASHSASQEEQEDEEEVIEFEMTDEWVERFALSEMRRKERAPASRALRARRLARRSLW